jgi:pimeloyl-ACP methyl ester carboxylesterase
MLVVAMAVALCPAAIALDKEREQRYADEIRDTLVVGEDVLLEADGETFLALYTDTQSSPKRGAVVLLHGLGAHPNWPDVIFPLREALPEHGWASLSLQMPIAARDTPFDAYIALFPEVPARVDAGLQYLREVGFERVVLLGHSLGALMAASHLANNPAGEIQGLVVVGLAASDLSPTIATVAFLKAIHVPVLDLYGEQDRPNVVSTAWVRRSASANNEDYTQVVVPGADHFFRNQNGDLIEAVKSWLDATFPE